MQSIFMRESVGMLNLVAPNKVMPNNDATFCIYIFLKKWDEYLDIMMFWASPIMLFPMANSTLKM